ncbi:MFS transporter [Wenjunlia tyrosinilytica]|uniref:MFS transporter n=1 Tax=Wenjunlia tyrosinilytica TaxID=1544741 RepID=A0A917ZNN4_9ACTN|nr:MFS transporter [Wenjunlia tyrosinilytica]GGO86807.1 MFS transporter [Wenjunlia tyrosinilytica]
MTETTALTTPADAAASPRPPRIHRAWWVAAVSFVALVGAAGFRATPSVFIDPLHHEFGWSHGTISAAVSVNLVLYGLTSPFAAALMERFGMRRVVASALALVAAGSGLTVFMGASWQLILCWGVLVGLGTGSMALAFVATVTSRWFVKRRGLVTGILTAGGAAGQLVFLPLLAVIADHRGWRTAALTVCLAALAVVPLVLWLLRDRPEDVGTTAYGAEPAIPVVAAPTDVPATAPAQAPAKSPAQAPAKSPAQAPAVRGGAAGRALGALFGAARTKAFWLLAGTFAICGATTNGLVGTHFVPAAHDHLMPTTTAASLLAVVGVFDLIGTIASGWFTDRFDSRRLLGVYYALRGVSLLFLPVLFAEGVHPPMLFFIVFYGLDWVATVPPTVALCREHFGDDGPIVFGWVLASHQVGAGLVAFLAGFARDRLGDYDAAWYSAGALCAVAAVMSLVIRRRTTATAVPVPA